MTWIAFVGSTVDNETGKGALWTIFLTAEMLILIEKTE
jgi:hypothetical protein